MRSHSINEGTIELQKKLCERSMIRFAMIMRTACFPEVSHRKILVKFSTYPNPLEWILLPKVITTTDSLNQSQAACRSIDHRIWLATVSHTSEDISTIKGHKCDSTPVLLLNHSFEECVPSRSSISGNDVFIELGVLIFGKQRGFWNDLSFEIYLCMYFSYTPTNR